jgi:hypothetical protein
MREGPAAVPGAPPKRRAETIGQARWARGAAQGICFVASFEYALSLPLPSIAVTAK